MADVSYSLKIDGGKQLAAAFKKSPAIVRSAASYTLTEIMTEALKIINRNPWRVGGSGGGAPVDTRNMLNHLMKSKTMASDGLSMSIGVDTDLVPYALFVHEGTKYMKARPWLDYAEKQVAPALPAIEARFLDTIAKELAK